VQDRYTSALRVGTNDRVERLSTSIIWIGCTRHSELPNLFLSLKKECFNEMEQVKENDGYEALTRDVWKGLISI